MPLQSATPAPAILESVLASLGLSQSNRPAIINFFRSDCPWCVVEMPRLSDVYARHAKLGIRVFAVAVGHDTPQSAQNFAREKALQIPVTTEQSAALKEAFQISRVPAVAFVNVHGLVERTYEGVTEQLPGIVEQALYALADDQPLPEYSMIGNGCAP